MAIYAIGDLHLSFTSDKPMDIFGSEWEKHYEKIEEAFRELVTDDDLVIIAGDTSWALHYGEARTDLEWVDRLPGKKVIIKGNHDYYWISTRKMQIGLETITFMHNSFYEFEGVAICGTRGWVCPGSKEFDEHDEKIYLRETMRLKASLEMAKKAGYEEIIGVLHYPPTNDALEESNFTRLFNEYGVKKVVYGHIHGIYCNQFGLKGEHFGVDYSLVSSDYIGFKPIRVR